MRPLLMLAALGSALGGGHGHGPVDRRPYPTKPSPEAEAETIRRAAEKRRRKGAARLAAAGRTVEAFDLSLGDVARTSLDDVCDSPPERAGDGWRGSITCHACPVPSRGQRGFRSDTGAPMRPPRFRRNCGRRTDYGRAANRRGLRRVVVGCTPRVAGCASHRARWTPRTFPGAPAAFPFRSVATRRRTSAGAFYFRARGEGWGFGVASTIDAAVAAGWADAEPGSWYAEGDAEGGDFAGSWMKHSEAWRIVEESIAAWRASRGTP